MRSATLVAFPSLFTCLLAFAAPSASAALSPVAVTGLSVDRMTDPLGIEDPAPQLGWRLDSAQRGARQTAYQVQVAEDEQKLTAEDDVWDSGVVESAESVAVHYGGPAPAARQRLVWRVRIRDGNGDESAWSAPGSWEMALTDGDWHGAEWISPHAATDAGSWTDYRIDVDFAIASGAAGVVFREAGPLNLYMWQINISGGEVLLRPHVQRNGVWEVLAEIPIGTVIPAAEAHADHHLRIVADGPDISTYVDGQLVDEREVNDFSTGGIGFRSGDGGEDASFSKLEVHDLQGHSLFSDGFADQPDPSFPGAPIEAGTLRARGGDTWLISTTPATPLLRKEFDLNQSAGNVASARIYAYGLGFYELGLSGTKVGNRVLTPAATDFERRLRYQTYDATADLKAGANVLGLALAEGYGPAFSRHGWRWTGPREARVLLAIRYENGEEQWVVSDGSWRWRSGPTREASIYGGERYDARLARAGWDEPGYAMSGAWQAVGGGTPPGGALEADTTPPVRVLRTLQPVAVTEPASKPGAYVFDFGENISGWARLHVRGGAGTTVSMHYAENLQADGTIDPTTNQRATATDTFILAGSDGGEDFEPTFTYHGFRYVEVTGLPEAPAESTLEARVVHADMAKTASFDSSDPMLNRIYADNRRTMENNAMSYPTDNPVRDERTGPGLDVQAYGDAAVRDFDADRFFVAYLREIGTKQYSGEWGGSPDMNAANVPLAWSLFEQYGDRTALEASYPGMMSAVDAYVAQTSGSDHVWPEPEGESGEGFGDWCPPLPEPAASGGVGGPEAGGYGWCFSEVSLVNTALAYRDARIVAAAAKVLGYPDEAAEYDHIAAAIAAGFKTAFANEGGPGYGSERQVTSILPLAFGMVPEAQRAAVGQALVDRVLGVDAGHLDTGIFGTRFLLDALAIVGRPDVAMTVLDQTSYPSFGYESGFGQQIGLGPGHGATTDWEEWTYRSSMETHDHAMFAGINASLISELAGIEPVEPGYAKVRIAPVLPPGLEHVAASLRTVRGEVSSSWRQSGLAIELDVTVPPNATAEVHMPTRADYAVTESGVPAAESPNVDYAGEDQGAAVYDVASGSYDFVAVPPTPSEETEPTNGGGAKGTAPRAAGTTRPPAPPRAGPLPRLRIAARALGRRRIALAISCRANCPTGTSRAHVVVASADRRRGKVLTRRDVRFFDSRARMRFRLPRGPLPDHLRVIIRGIAGTAIVREARLRGRLVKRRSRRGHRHRGRRRGGKT